MDFKQIFFERKLSTEPIQVCGQNTNKETKQKTHKKGLLGIER